MKPSYQEPAGKPSGKGYAFFDVDGTLLSLRSFASFEQFYVRSIRADASAITSQWREQSLAFSLAHVYTRLPRAVANRRFYRRYRGRRPELVEHTIARWYGHLLSSGCKVYHAGPVRELKRLQAADVAPVFVSGSSVEILRPFAEAQGVEHILATTLELRSGVYTGRILPPQTIGIGKRLAIEGFLASHGVCAEHCYAFGDHESDLPMLEHVGRPQVVAGDPAMEHLAQARGWPVISLA